MGDDWKPADCEGCIFAAEQAALVEPLCCMDELGAWVIGPDDPPPSDPRGKRVWRAMRIKAAKERKLAEQRKADGAGLEGPSAVEGDADRRRVASPDD